MCTIIKQIHVYCTFRQTFKKNIIYHSTICNNYTLNKPSTQHDLNKLNRVYLGTINNKASSLLEYIYTFNSAHCSRTGQFPIICMTQLHTIYKIWITFPCFPDIYITTVKSKKEFIFKINLNNLSEQFT